MEATQRVDLKGGGQASYTVVGDGEPLLWLEGGPGFPAKLGRPDCELVAHFADGARASVRSSGSKRHTHSTLEDAG